MRLVLSLAILAFPIGLLGESVSYRFGDRYYPQAPGVLPNPASPYIAAANREHQARLEEVLRRATLGQSLPSTSISSSDIASPILREHWEWVHDYAERISKPENQSIQGLAKPQFEALVSRDPISLVESLDQYFATYKSLQKDLPETAKALKDIGVSGFVDSDGLIYGLPDAPKTIDLMSPWDSNSGIKIRHGVNRLMVSKQIFEGEYRLRCSDNASAACLKLKLNLQSFRTHYEELSLAYGIADRLAFSSTLSPIIDELLTKLGATVDSYYLYAKSLFLGAREGVFAFLEGTIQTIGDPAGTLQAVAVGLSNALINYDRTYALIKHALGNAAVTYLYGSTEERGKLVGRLTFEIATVCLPLATAEKIVLASKSNLIQNTVERAATTVGVGLYAEELIQAGRISKESSDAVRSISKVFPETSVVLLRNPLQTSAKGIGGVPDKVLQTAGKSDVLVKDLIKASPSETLDFLIKHGPEATAGISKLREPKIFTEWKKAGKLDELAELGRHISREIDVARHAPEFQSLKSFTSFALEHMSKGEKLSTNSQMHFIRQAASSSLLQENLPGKVFSVKKFQELHRTFEKLEAGLPSVHGKKVEVTVSRGIHKEYFDETGKLVKTDPKKIFEISPSNTLKNHRYTQPGERALYTTLGDGENTIRIIEQELRSKRDALYIDTTKIKLNKVLDLTEENVLNKLGLKIEDVCIPNVYETTQQLGFLAKKNGFDAIKTFTSVESKNDFVGINIIILRD